MYDTRSNRMTNGEYATARESRSLPISYLVKPQPEKYRNKGMKQNRRKRKLSTEIYAIVSCHFLFFGISFFRFSSSSFSFDSFPQSIFFLSSTYSFFSPFSRSVDVLAPTAVFSAQAKTKYFHFGDDAHRKERRRRFCQ